MIEALERFEMDWGFRMAWVQIGGSGCLGSILLAGRRCPWSQSSRWQVRLVYSSISTPGAGVEMCLR